MRVILIAAGGDEASSPLDRRHLGPMLPLVDRPFLQHVIEYLMDQGASRFDLVLNHLPEQVEEWLGDGMRWGGEWASRFHIHLVQDPAKPYDLLRFLSYEPDERVLLAHADRLPQADLGDLAEGRLCHGGDWSGWAVLQSQRLEHLPQGLDAEGLAFWIRLLGVTVEVPCVLGARSYQELMDAHLAVLEGRFGGLIITGQEVEKGIWLSRNVSLHPTAGLTPPVYIGENCRIGAGTELGPGAVIGRDCVLDKKCKLERALVLPRTYVGQSLDLVEVLADRDYLYNYRLGVDVALVDNFILGGIGGRKFSDWAAGTATRLAAVGLLCVFWPVLLAMAVWLKMTRKGAVLHRREVVRLPASLHQGGWKTFALWSFESRPGRGGRLRHFMLEFLPALVNVARGDLRFVGLPPRSREEVAALPSDWRALYLRSRAGIVSEVHTHFRDHVDEDERYAVEAFAAVTRGAGYSARVLGRYLRGMKMAVASLN